MQDLTCFLHDSSQKATPTILTQATLRRGLQRVCKHILQTKPFFGARSTHIRSSLFFGKPKCLAHRQTTSNRTLSNAFAESSTGVDRTCIQLGGLDVVLLYCQQCFPSLSFCSATVASCGVQLDLPCRSPLLIQRRSHPLPPANQSGHQSNRPSLVMFFGTKRNIVVLASSCQNPPCYIFARMCNLL